MNIEEFRTWILRPGNNNIILSEGKFSGELRNKFPPKEEVREVIQRVYINNPKAGTYPLHRGCFSILIKRNNMKSGQMSLRSKVFDITRKSV